MHFAAPAFLLGLLGIAIPIVLHLRGKRRAKTVRFSALEFLLASQKKRAPWLRLRRWLLLAARIGAIAALSFALAKPFRDRKVDLPAGALGAQSAVLVLDDSLSMQWKAGPSRLFDLARTKAEEILALLGDGAEVALVLGGEGARAPISDLTTDRAAARQVVAELEPSFAAADLPLALRRANQILQSSTLKERRIFVLSDGAAHAWGSEAALPASPSLTIIDVHPDQVPSNHAILGASALAQPELGPEGARVVVELANFSDTALAKLPLTLRTGSQAALRILVDIPAWGVVRKPLSAVFSAAGPREIVLETTEDGLAADDRIALPLALGRPIRVLLANGDPRTVAREDELYYLETALVSAADAESLRVETIAAEALPLRLEGYDVVFLCNARAPDPARVQALRDFVQRGGGLFLSMGDNVDAAQYVKVLGSLLPQPLQGVWVEPSSAGGAAGSAMRLGEAEWNHPVLSPFSSQAAGLRTARFSRLMLLGSPLSAKPRQVLLRFSNSAPALVESRLGQGRVLLFASTVDRDWTDLPIHPDFLPLMKQIALYLGRADMGSAPIAIKVGHPRQIALGQNESRVRITSPSGAKKVLDRHKSEDASVTFNETQLPGIYHVEIQRAGGQLEARAELDFSVLLDPKESDFRKAKAAGSSMISSTAPGSSQPHRPVLLSHIVAAALLGFLLVEGILLRPS